MGLRFVGKPHSRGKFVMAGRADRRLPASTDRPTFSHSLHPQHPTDYQTGESAICIIPTGTLNLFSGQDWATDHGFLQSLSRSDRSECYRLLFEPITDGTDIGLASKRRQQAFIPLYLPFAVHYIHPCIGLSCQYPVSNLPHIHISSWASHVSTPRSS